MLNPPHSREKPIDERTGTFSASWYLFFSRIAGSQAGGSTGTQQSALASVAGYGLYVLTRAGAAVRSVVSSTLSIANGDGQGGNIAVDLSELADTGVGDDGLCTISRDAYGRIEGTAPATAADLPFDDADAASGAADVQAALVIALSALAYFSDTAPDPDFHKFWVDTNDMTPYLWYDDGTSAAWVNVFGGGGDVAGETHAATDKATPVDADEIPLVDSASSFSLKKLTWANLKATAKAYFDTLYTPLGGGGGGGGGAAAVAYYVQDMQNGVVSNAATTTIPSTITGPTYFPAGSSGTASLVNAAGHPGIVRLNAVGSTSALVRLHVAPPQILMGGGEIVGRWHFNLPVASTAGLPFSLDVGFRAVVTGPGDLLSIGYTHSANSGNWRTNTSVAGVLTSVNFAVGPVINTYYTIEAVINAAGTSISWYQEVAGVRTLIGTDTAIPTGAVGQMMGIGKTGVNNTSVVVDVDYFEFKQTLTTAR